MPFSYELPDDCIQIIIPLASQRTRGRLSLCTRGALKLILTHTTKYTLKMVNNLRCAGSAEVRWAPWPTLMIRTGVTHVGQESYPGIAIINLQLNLLFKALTTVNIAELRSVVIDNDHWLPCLPHLKNLACRLEQLDCSVVNTGAENDNKRACLKELRTLKLIATTGVTKADFHVIKGIPATPKLRSLSIEMPILQFKPMLLHSFDAPLVERLTLSDGPLFSFANEAWLTKGTACGPDGKFFHNPAGVFPLLNTLRFHIQGAFDMRSNLSYTMWYKFGGRDIDFKIKAFGILYPKNVEIRLKDGKLNSALQLQKTRELLTDFLYVCNTLPFLTNIYITRRTELLFDQKDVNRPFFSQKYTEVIENILSIYSVFHTLGNYTTTYRANSKKTKGYFNIHVMEPATAESIRQPVKEIYRTVASYAGGASAIVNWK
jgi:hypothetical protein